MNPFEFSYPGRFIIVGKDAGALVALYGATGRSPSSLARRFVQEGSGIFMTGIDETVKEGNRELLEYPAIRIFANGVLVANGSHIERISEFQSRDARQQLSYALAEEAYEPDEYRTPRITGCVIESPGGIDAALHIVRSVPQGIDRSSWSVPLEEGKGLYVGTYIGEDVKPTPAFPGDPLPVSLQFGSAKAAAQALFDAYAPEGGAADYRVGFVAVYKKLGEEVQVAIMNRH